MTGKLGGLLTTGRGVQVKFDITEHNVNHEKQIFEAQRIIWELERTAMGDGYFGNALRVTKDVNGVTDDDRALLDRYATGAHHGTDHVALQALAMKIMKMEEK